jgi:dTMP kinase
MPGAVKEPSVNLPEASCAFDEIMAAWDSGFVVAVCGIDGSGKSSVMEELAARTRGLGLECTTTRQPTAFYRSSEHVRTYHDNGVAGMWEEGIALLSACDRLLHLRTEVVPALRRGGVVISDRFLHATYAIFEARGVDAEWLRSINAYCPPPHLCVLLDCPAEVAMRRIHARGGYIRLEERSYERLEAIRQRYLAVVPDDAVVIDATQPAERVLNEAVEALAAALDGYRHADLERSLRR